MDDQLKSLEEQASGRRDLENPPLHQWNPPLSGDIPIVIKSDGRWYHDGGKIKRPALVKLFASILRREMDGEYYLVTPGEKWRIEVEGHPLVVTDFELAEEDGSELIVILNTGRRVTIGAEHPLSLDAATSGVAVVALDHGLTAVFSRAAWYRLVDTAKDIDGVPCVTSGEEVYRLL